MNNFPFQIVGFDLDGTLLDTRADLGAALNHALAGVGRDPVPVAELADLIGGGARLMLERALARTGGAEGIDVGVLHRELIAYYKVNIAVHTRLFPGGADMLDALEQRGVKLALVTNKLESLARILLEELDLTRRFATIIGGDTMGPGRNKPAPDQLHEMIARLGGSASHTAYVGDTTYDTKAARAAGIPSVACSFGFNDVPPDQLGADAVIGHFSELVPVLALLG
ncbi:MAG: HAD-IA family hydrolase [Novosphingobium sp.]